MRTNKDMIDRWLEKNEVKICKDYNPPKKYKGKGYNTYMTTSVSYKKDTSWTKAIDTIENEEIRKGV